jgi:hypothetical protein
VGLERPELVVVVEVVERLFDRLAVGPRSVRLPQPLDRFRGEVLEGDAVPLGLLRDRAGGQVDRDQVPALRQQQALDLAAAGDIGVQGDGVTVARRPPPFRRECQAR